MSRLRRLLLWLRHPSCGTALWLDWRYCDPDAMRSDPVAFARYGLGVELSPAQSRELGRPT